MTQTDEIVRFLTRAELRAWLDLSEDTILAWEKRGMPVIRYQRKVRLYDVAAVVAWMREQPGEKEKRTGT